MSTWPTHPDGTNKTVGEMTPQERQDVWTATADRMEQRGDVYGARMFRRLADRATA